MGSAIAWKIMLRDCLECRINDKKILGHERGRRDNSLCVGCLMEHIKYIDKLVCSLLCRCLPL